MFQACLNESRLPVEHPCLPVTAAELAHETNQVYGADVDIVHLHVKDGHRADTLDAAPMAEVLDAVRAKAPSTTVGQCHHRSLDDAGPPGAGASDPVLDRPARLRLSQLARARRAEDVAAALLEQGVGVEPGLWHADPTLFGDTP